MLIILLFAMMHNAFPHVHHEHEIGRNTELRGDSHHHHHDSDHHHHSDDDENDQVQKTFFDFLFNNHSHTTHAHQYTPATVEHVKSIKQIVVKVFGTTESWEFYIKENDVGLHRYVLFNDIGSNHPFLYSNPLRGPPSIG